MAISMAETASQITARDGAVSNTRCVDIRLCPSVDGYGTMAVDRFS
jgi:hypothetical protein